MIRFLVILGWATLIGAAVLLLTGPASLVQVLPPVLRSPIVLVAAAVLGASGAVAVLIVYLRLRLASLVGAAERIADGDYSVNVHVVGVGLEARLAGAIDRISKAFADTHARATVDRLTGVANRQSLMGALFSEVERANRYERPLAVAFVDIDHFKAVNDTYGHTAGDIILRGVAQALSENLRASDQIGRYGGEEFMLILTETSVEDGAIIAEKLRALVQRLSFSVDGNSGLSVTISIGLAGGVGRALRMEALVRNADAAMYSAKSLGRNQTYIFAEPDEGARVPRAPISAAGRARAVEIGRAARDAAAATLASIIAPLPQYRGRPSTLIASIVSDMAEHLDLPGADVDRLRTAALLHDIGKIAVPQEILDKPSSLTPAEWRTVVQHPRIGQIILEQAATIKDAVPIILHHHERYGGHGYPYGLRGNEIPLGARIVAVADAYDAMTNDRPYKRAMSHEQAIAELRRHSGTQFDPELVAVFCELYADSAPQPDATIVAIESGRDAVRAFEWPAFDVPVLDDETFLGEPERRPAVG